MYLSDIENEEKILFGQYLYVKGNNNLFSEASNAIWLTE